ncbi:hypothetical protein [Acetonema longum]|nr:hypothetical protein [Acetonema longum]
MNGDSINRLVILALALTVLGDFLALLAELLNQRYTNNASKEAEIKLQDELNQIHGELAALKARFDQSLPPGG